MIPISPRSAEHRPPARSGSGPGQVLIIFLLSLIGASIPPPEAAASETAVFSFLEIDQAARPASMSGAYTALADDVHSLHWNPAGLGKLGSQQLLFSYLHYIVDVTSGAFSYAGGGLGIGISYMNYGQIPADFGVEAPGTTFPMTSPYDLVLTLGYGGKVTDGARLGGSVKGVQESILSYAAQGVGFDLGLQLDTHFGFPQSWGICLKDLGYQTKAFRGERRRLPARLTLGVAVPVVENMLTLAGDGTYVPDRSGIDWSCGAEYTWDDLLRVRAGYRSAGADLNTGSELDPWNGLSIGFGLGFWGSRLDYAFVPFNVLGNVHRVSLTLDWGAPPAQTHAKPRTPPQGSALVPSPASKKPASGASLALPSKKSSSPTLKEKPSRTGSKTKKKKAKKKSKKKTKPSKSSSTGPLPK